MGKAPLVGNAVSISVTLLTNSALSETKSTPNGDFNGVVGEAVFREVEGGDVKALEMKDLERWR